MKYLALLLLLPSCGLITGTYDDDEVEVWWCWYDRCEDWGGAVVNDRWLNSTVILVLPDHGECGLSLLEACLEGLGEYDAAHGPVTSELQVREADLWEAVVDAVNAYNLSHPGAFPEPVAKW